MPKLITADHRTEPIARRGIPHSEAKSISGGSEDPMKAKPVPIVVDGVAGHAEMGTTLLAAAAAIVPGLAELCACRIPCLGLCQGLCLVELEGVGELKRACAIRLQGPILCQTYSRRIRRERRRILSELVSNRRIECGTCGRRRACDLRKLARAYDIDLSADPIPLREGP